MSKTLRTPRQRKLLALLIKLRKAKGLTQADVAARLKRTQERIISGAGTFPVVGSYDEVAETFRRLFPDFS